MNRDRNLINGTQLRPGDLFAFRRLRSDACYLVVSVIKIDGANVRVIALDGDCRIYRWIFTPWSVCWRLMH